MTRVYDLRSNVKSTFDVGDFVWAKTQSQTWWPGFICDPSTKKPSKCIQQEPSLLVKYIGNGGCVWCITSDLKHFLHHFNELSSQIDSRNFYGSVERALFLYGQRVKANMTCACFSKVGDMNSAERMPPRTKGGVFSPSQFDPRAFLSRIREMGRSNHVCGKVELTTTKNCLSAFYCSLGHLSLPLHVILKHEDRAGKATPGSPENRTRIKRNRDRDAAGSVIDTALTSNGKGPESRERKKSKYLSYPYTDAKTEPSATALDEPKGSSSCSSKNLLKKCDNGASKGDSVVSKLEHIIASPSELLAELHSAARSCSNPNGISGKEVEEVKEDENRKMDVASVKDGVKEAVTNESTEVESPVVKEFDKGRLNVASVKDSTSEAMTKELPEMKKNLPKETLKDIPVMFQSTLSSISAGRKISPNTFNFQHNSSDAFQDISSSQRGVIPQINRMVMLPDLNGNISNLSVEKNSPVKFGLNRFSDNVLKQTNKVSTDHVKNGVNRISFGSITSLEGAQLALQSPEKSVPGNANIRGGKAGFESSFTQKVPMALYASVVDTKYQKRKQMERASEPGIPDLNRNASDKCFPGITPTSDHNYSSPECKPDESKAGLNMQESIGGSLILTFSSGCTLPPKEALVTTFSRFGLLNESQIEVVDESTIRVPYQRSSEARFAFRSLEKNKPFGTALATFKLDCPADITRPVKRRVVIPSVTQQSSPLFSPVRIPGKPSETPGIAFMKRNVEMMKTTLEKAGASLSPEVRAKLENEIKVFLNKINSMGGSGAT